MLARATAATPWGIEARVVEVEVDVQNGLPGIQIVGLPDAAVRESRERVRSALRHCGYDLPPRAVTVNLAPADLRKEGSHLDLAIALALLGAHGALPGEALGGRVLIGELGLDGAIRPVRGALAIADLTRGFGLGELLLPEENAGEAAAIGEGAAVFGVRAIGDAVAHLVGEQRLERAEVREPPVSETSPPVDFREVHGQATAKRALEVAAAGGHNALLIGPPGAGKTMLARALAGILPPLTRAESIAVTKIHSLVAERPASGLLRTPPFRSPHPGVSTAGLIGGGSIPRPGETSLAHAGVLFLDELAEFRRDALEALRMPLEEGRIAVSRARAQITFPARFTLIAAMNPCPCGHLGDERHPCRCPLPAVERYRSRVSGPLLDRIDLHVEVPALRIRDLRDDGSEPSAAIAERVLAARRIQRERAGPEKSASTNAALSNRRLRRVCALDDTGRRLLDGAFERLGLSARAFTRVLRVARTIADLAGAETIRPGHLAEAIQYRSLDRRLTGPAPRPVDAS